jgi:Zn-dependent peptidase ImmA (M78 family)
MNELDEARAQASALVKRLGLKAPPVPVDKLAKILGVRIDYSPFDDELSGMAFIRDGKPVIGVNSNHHPNRQRFTIAHELAQKQANAFASELLMPERLVRQVLAESSRDIQDDDYLIGIANRFRVSLAALQFTLRRL